MSDPGKGHETRDLNLRAVVLFAVGLLLVGLATHWMVARLFKGLQHREDRKDVPAPPDASRELPPEPRLEEISTATLGALRRREEQELGTYAWVDRPRGIVRVPIERAMQILLQRGLPARRTTGANQ